MDVNGNEMNDEYRRHEKSVSYHDMISKNGLMMTCEVFGCVKLLGSVLRGTKFKTSRVSYMLLYS